MHIARILTIVLFTLSLSTHGAQQQPPKLKALLVAGGCCHDYAGQHKVLYQGIQARADVQVDVFWTDDTSVNPPLPLYDNPNKTIAQGFATHVITLKDETVLTGFITNEAADQVSLRDILSQEHTVKKSLIVSRRTLPTSIMPSDLIGLFTVKEMASLLDYLEGLVKTSN